MMKDIGSLVWQRADQESVEQMRTKPNFIGNLSPGHHKQGNCLAAGGGWFQDKSASKSIHQLRVS